MNGSLLSPSESGHGYNTTSLFSSRSISRRPKKSSFIIAITVFIFLCVPIITNSSSIESTLVASLPKSSSSPETWSLSPIPDPQLKAGNSTLTAIGDSYVKAILSPNNTDFPRLECSSPSGDRYLYLQDQSAQGLKYNQKPTYFFALNLYQCLDILPRLMGSIIEAIRFLGPENCVLSIVEGRSNDGTYEVLKLLKDEIDEWIGTRLFLNTSDIDPGNFNDRRRIIALAELRNLALQPLVEHAERYDPNVTVVFINDVAICVEDILELIHQRRFQQADMTCAMDWTFVGGKAMFYDSWLARGMNGDSFYNIPADGK